MHCWRAWSGGLGQKVQTFTIGFKETGYDESSIASASAKHFGVEHHEAVASTDLLRFLPDLVRHYGEPFADKSALATLLVCELTRRHVKVALSGDGGDEAFAGYSKYILKGWQHRSSSLFSVQRKENWTLDSITGEGWLGSKPLRNLRRQLLPRNPQSFFSSEFFSGRPYQHIATPFLRAESADFVNDLVRQFCSKKLEPVDRMLNWDNTQPLPDGMLVKLDIASMAHSLEVRSPFLDHELVELCASLPADWKVNNRQGKLILRDIVGPDLPPQIMRSPQARLLCPLG